MNQHIESYLETVGDSLRGLPAAEQESEIAEIRQHLEALVQARRELGETEMGATAQAVAQFGQANMVRRRLRTAYFRRRLAAFRQSWIGAVACTFFAAVLGSVVSSHTVSPLYRWISGESITVFYWCLCASLFIECWFIGWLSVRLSSWRCLPVISGWMVFFYYVYVAPQLRHEDMPYGIWIQTVTTSAIIMATPLLSALIALRRARTFRRA